MQKSYVYIMTFCCKTNYLNVRDKFNLSQIQHLHFDMFILLLSDIFHISLQSKKTAVKNRSLSLKIAFTSHP